MEENDDNETGIVWPVTDDVPTAELAIKTVEFISALNNRSLEDHERSLEAALAVWPTLKQAMNATGREISLSGGAKPILPDWANQPVVAVGNRMPTRAKTKAEAMEFALKHGHNQWATIGECWLWVAGGGPIVEKSLQSQGYGSKEPIPDSYGK